MSGEPEGGAAPAEIDTLVSGARELGVALDETTASSLVEYLDLLYHWDRTQGLTRIPRSDAVRLHLLDSLSLVPFVRSAATLVDLGSGAGLPGIPVAAALPELDVLLVETRRRRCTFLAECIRELELRSCAVLEEDARVLAASGRTFDAVVGRAFRPPVPMAELGAALVAPGGLLLLMAGREEPDLAGVRTAAGAAFEIESDRTFRLPTGSERRRVCGLRRVG